MSETRPSPATKKSYVKPEASPVPLRPEEAVLGSCKIGGGAGFVLGTCGTTCSNAGS